MANATEENCITTTAENESDESPTPMPKKEIDEPLGATADTGTTIDERKHYYYEEEVTLRQQMQLEIESLKQQLSDTEDRLQRQREVTADQASAIIAAQRKLISEKNMQNAQYQRLISELKTQNGYLQAQLMQAEKKLSEKSAVATELASISKLKGSFAGTAGGGGSVLSGGELQPSQQQQQRRLSLLSSATGGGGGGYARQQSSPQHARGGSLTSPLSASFAFDRSGVLSMSGGAGGGADLSSSFVALPSALQGVPPPAAPLSTDPEQSLDINSQRGRLHLRTLIERYAPSLADADNTTTPRASTGTGGSLMGTSPLPRELSSAEPSKSPRGSPRASQQQPLFSGRDSVVPVAGADSAGGTRASASRRSTASPATSARAQLSELRKAIYSQHEPTATAAMENR